MTSQLTQILMRPELIDGVFCKVITRNDDSGRHGVLIPQNAYKFFPEIAHFVPHTPENHTESITTLWKTEMEEHVNLWETTFGTEAKASSFKHYHRYPERRVTALRSRKLDMAPVNTIILFGRRKDLERTYECHVFYPEEPEYQQLAEEFAFTGIYPGLSFLNDEWSISSTVTTPGSLEELLALFDEVSKIGYIKTLRPGDTGVGYTFETLLNIRENNDRTADYKGIEIKSYRSEELKMAGTDKQNLFLQEPVWIDGISTPVQRIREYGYFDDRRSRYAWYSTVKINPNSHGLAFTVSNGEKELRMTRGSLPVARYDYDVIDQRLKEKHRETVFIAASAKGTGANEMFHYRTLTYCVNASVKSFIPLVESGHVMLEIRMHVKPDGSARNHGSAFRINKNKLPDLFSVVRNLRGELK